MFLFLLSPSNPTDFRAYRIRKPKRFLEIYINFTALAGRVIKTQDKTFAAFGRFKRRNDRVALNIKRQVYFINITAAALYFRAPPPFPLKIFKSLFSFPGILAFLTGWGRK